MTHTAHTAVIQVKQLTPNTKTIADIEFTLLKNIIIYGKKS